MNPLYLIPAPYRYAAIAVAITIVLAVTYFTGRSHGLEKYYDYKSSVESEMEAVRVENEAKLAAMADVAHHAAEGWESARAALAARPRVRVSNNCSQGGLSATSTASTRVEGLQASELGLSPTRTIAVEECEARINGSVMDAVWIETIKKLTDDLHEASK